jgi:hypothetical protein
MTEDTLRHYCRNQKCRTRLPAPVSNPRDAFCCPGCHARFYFRRCIVCERDMPRNAPNQRTCYRFECKTTWRNGTIISGFLGIGSGSRRAPLGKPIKSGIKTADKADRQWRTVAGPPLGPRNLAAATVPDGPGMVREGGAFEASEARSRTALDAFFANRTVPPINDWCAICGRLDDLKDIRVGDDWKVVCYGCHSKKPEPAPSNIPDDLSIPGYLRRMRS